MNRRQVDLLKKLIIQDDYQPIKYFSAIFGTSMKTISKDLDDIEEIISPTGARIERKQGRGIKLCYTLPQLDKLNEILNNISPLDSDKTVEDRRTEILLNLLINTNKYTTIQKLSDKYMVSRTSINNDLKEVQERLKKYNLELSKTLKGTRIIGSEINIRKALVSTIQEYAKINPGYISEYQSIRHKELNIAEINSMLNSKSISFFEELLNKLENELKLVIYEPYYTNLLSHLVIMTNRIINGNYIEDNPDYNNSMLAMNERLYDAAVYLIKEIEKKFDIKINKQEIAYVYKYLISVGLSFEDDKKCIKEADLSYVYFTKDLISIISQMLDVNYDLSLDLYDKLLLHVRPMLNRAKYNIQIKNPLLDDFLREFEEEFFIVKVGCFLLCNRYGVNMINDHEVAYILSYFISENEKMASAIKVRTVVICHSGYGTSRLLAARLAKTFSNIEISGIISSNAINSADLEKVDLIVSTVDLDTDKPYLIISAFLNEIDKENVKNYIENILESKKKSISSEHEEISIKFIDDKEGIKEFISLLIEDELIHVKDNIYLYLRAEKANSARKYLIEKKCIIAVDYSDYSFLSKVIRFLIREGLDKEGQYGK
ncbi:Transcriptional antiterminator, BglG [Tepidanaerobacter acetatoxydans Re1]|uniref:Transcriptional antiterminator, BglG n=1 Tax=Tepidanaerobacter acetatoxydans (strain DSM 21804 / JCM 16047 / Re1) TaxID=1209989 RepID=F4LS34_TEPAE|nr:PRD domain-containing protein [Tepidanaerobacter acetatoxydans]AEE92373.1 transcriptional antiterminator, BglG [Tepidanaerobacter acetatoxydans Re1]CDI40984.1 Transcriptional antiterminator, BglG [Tepidanaerobacter acetatoxydans Re1]